MEGYHFWKDVLDTYQSSSDLIQALWLIVPPAFLLGLIALLLRHRVQRKRAAKPTFRDVIYPLAADQPQKTDWRHVAPLIQNRPPEDEFLRALLENRDGDEPEKR